MGPEWTHVSSFSSVQGAVLFSEALFCVYIWSSSPDQFIYWQMMGHLWIMCTYIRIYWNMYLYHVKDTQCSRQIMEDWRQANWINATELQNLYKTNWDNLSGYYATSIMFKAAKLDMLPGIQIMELFTRRDIFGRTGQEGASASAPCTPLRSSKVCYLILMLWFIMIFSFDFNLII